MDIFRMEDWRTPAVSFAAAVFGALIALVGQHWTSSRERDTRMVEIALGMLRVEPKEDALKAVRPWVIRVVEQHSGTPFRNEEREALLKGALPYVPPAPVEPGGRLPWRMQ
jgi:hypothetical protein